MEQLRRDESTYESLRAGFSWDLPPTFNIATACADRHPQDALALIDIRQDGSRREVTFGDLTCLSKRLANALAGLGLAAGDRVAIVLPQCLETGLVHLAAYRMTAIAVPMSGLFGPDALMHRLGDCGARIVVTDVAHADLVTSVVGELDADVKLLIIDGEPAGPHRSFWGVLEQASAEFATVLTTPETPALIIYTSGTTGAAKGALHGHRVLLGHLPGVELSHEYFPMGDDRCWTPADWAWIGSLVNVLLPCWYFGRTIVAAAHQKFDPQWGAEIIEDERVRNTFLPPTALKLIRAADLDLSRTRLRTIMCGGESLGGDLLAWARDAFRVTINEIYGQTEANYVAGNCASTWPVKPGSIGRPYPGHEVAVLDEDFSRVLDGELGQLAVAVPDPVVFLGYWNRRDATEAKFDPSGRWLLTGDRGSCDGDGYLWFDSRDDDVINSSGYRIGPGEIEQCLQRHPAVLMAAAVGVPDAVRGERVKAFVSLREGHVPSADLAAEIQDLVRTRLAAYLYPREIEFIDGLPLTITGKVRRQDLRRLHEDGAAVARDQPGA